MNLYIKTLTATLISLLLMGSGTALRINQDLITGDAQPRLLSEFGFFDGGADHPSNDLIAYTLNTQLFSDYADKARLIYLPDGATLNADGDGLVDFPVGSAIIKTFSFRQVDGTVRHVETRLLLHRATGWVAVPYIWRADGSDADLRLAGGRMPVSFVDARGGTHTISYAVPNRNQCRTCHQRDEVLTPIGPQLRNLQLTPRLRAAFLGGDVTQTYALPSWDDAGAPLVARARAYLDVNCAHCHHPHGSASSSGLFLEYDRPMGMATGVWKRPTAAGRGSGSLEYAIVPGDPARSILLYRMRSTDPGIAMPELGRSLVHDEGVALIEHWIAAMPRSSPPTGGQP